MSISFFIIFIKTNCKARMNTLVKIFTAEEVNFGGKSVTQQQVCGVGRFFRIPTLTPSHKLFKFNKSTPTPDSDSPTF